jgi:hypothetical protein
MSGFEVAAVSSGQKGVYLPFFGLKFKLIFFSKFDGIFLHYVKELLFGHPRQNVSPNGWAVFEVTAILSGKNSSKGSKTALNALKQPKTVWTSLNKLQNCLKPPNMLQNTLKLSETTGA